MGDQEVLKYYPYECNSGNVWCDCLQGQRLRGSHTFFLAPCIIKGRIGSVIESSRFYALTVYEHEKIIAGLVSQVAGMETSDSDSATEERQSNG